MARAYCSCGTCNPEWFLHGWICYPDTPWDSARGNSRPRNWIIRGPPCNICMINSGDPYARIRDRLTTPERNYIQLHHPNLQNICYDCTQKIFDERHKRWWMEVFRGHSILTDSMIQSRISKYLWLSMHDTVCRCGNCDPFWLTREGLLLGCYMDPNHPGQAYVRRIETASTHILLGLGSMDELTAACAAARLASDPIARR